jgi:hypothetical protein
MIPMFTLLVSYGGPEARAQEDHLAERAAGKLWLR